MAELIQIPVFKDKKGELAVIENILPFEIKRVYFIYNSDFKERGYHSHKKTIQALICLNGSCSVHVQNTGPSEQFKLNNPSKCLILKPEDFHWMNNFEHNCVLLVLASHNYDKEDYVY